MGRGELGGVNDIPERRCRFWGRQGRFIEQTTHFDEQTCSLSRNSIVWVLGVPCTSFIAWLAVSKVGAAVWVLVVAQVVVFRPFVSDVVAVVDGDVAVEWRGLGLEGRGCGSCWGSVS